MKAVPTPSYNPQHKAVLDSILLKVPGVKPGRMFGYPAYYVNGKLFACAYDEGVGIKIPEQLARELLDQKRAIPFQPLGKAKMREWVQINHKRSTDYTKDHEILIRSVQFVASLAKATPRSKSR